MSEHWLRRFGLTLCLLFCRLLVAAPVQRVYMTHLGGSIRRCHHPIGAHKLAGREHPVQIGDHCDEIRVLNPD